MIFARFPLFFILNLKEKHPEQEWRMPPSEKLCNSLKKYRICFFCMGNSPCPASKKNV